MHKFAPRRLAKLVLFHHCKLVVFSQNEDRLCAELQRSMIQTAHVEEMRVV